MKNNAKIKGRYRFNIVDVLLLLIIILSVAAIAFLFFYDGDTDQAEVKDDTYDIIYTVEQKQIPDILRGKVNMGDSVFASNGTSDIGHVIDFMYTDSRELYYDENMGHTNYSVYEGKIDLTVKINVKATKKADGIFEINGQLISVGREIEVRFPFYTGTVVCSAVSEMSEVSE